MLLVVIVSCAVQIVIWVWTLWGLRAARGTESGPSGETASALEPSTPVSVVVAARNEADDLPELLQCLRRQDADRFEVVVVNDRSVDATAEVLARESARGSGEGRPFRIVTVNDDPRNGRRGKKEALAAGITAAQHERLVFTDADGRPGRRWVSRMAAAGSDLPESVLVGYGPILKRPGWLNRFVRYETVHTATLSAAAIGHGRAWHAVGRNFSYPKTLFERLGGFESHGESLSGDDDLFVQQVARETDVPIRYLFDPDTFVPSEGPASWRAFLRQRRRHAAAGKHYNARVLTALGGHHATNLGLWLGALALHVVSASPLGWAFVAAKLLLQRSVLRETMKSFRAEGDLSLAQPVLDPCLSLYQTVAAILGTLPSPKRW